MGEGKLCVFDDALFCSIIFVFKNSSHLATSFFLCLRSIVCAAGRKKVKEVGVFVDGGAFGVGFMEVETDKTELGRS